MNEEFTLRIIDGFDVNPGCLKCRRKRINSTQFCGRCFATNSLIVNSGNINIDDFIKETHSPFKNLNVPFLEWAPYDEFTNIELIGIGGFSQIYKATWKKNDGINYILNGGTFDRSKNEIVLKVLKDSQNVDTEFLKEMLWSNTGATN
ncbi:104_t:CDS:2 [Diversispora eburnea]|uniref:104_t:CDS:1 n=1 Tax=Diversispora eburnea TaxID=1213867 RepID=A0A9N8YWV9_9GLOM|nr:104_t:CDS:2 [Diversispora eburnea]